MRVINRLVVRLRVISNFRTKAMFSLKEASARIESSACDDALGLKPKLRMAYVV